MKNQTNDAKGQEGSQFFRVFSQAVGQKMEWTTKAIVSPNAVVDAPNSKLTIGRGTQAVVKLLLQ